MATTFTLLGNLGKPEKGDLGWWSVLNANEDKIDPLFLDIVNVKAAAYGATGNGTTDDTVAIINAIAAAYGKILYFPPGQYLVGALTLSGAQNFWIQGSGKGQTVLLARDNSQITLSCAGDIADRYRRIDGLTFSANNKTSTEGFRGVTISGLAIKNCSFEYVVAGIGIHVDRARDVAIENIDTTDNASLIFESTSTSDWVFALSVMNLRHISVSPTLRSSTTAWIRCTRVVNSNWANLVVEALNGVADGIVMDGDCQGIFISNAVIVFPATGLRSTAGTWVPGYLHFSNVSVDQPSVSGAIIDARDSDLVNCLFTGGNGRLNTGPGLLIGANSTRVRIVSSSVTNMRNNGLQIDSGAIRINVIGCDITTNNLGTGFFDLSATASNPSLLNTLRFLDNRVGSISSNLRVNTRGETTPILNNQFGSVGTPASTAATQLFSHTLLAGILNIGNQTGTQPSLRIRAWGTTAANTNSKSIALFFGATAVANFTFTTSGASWEVEALVMIKSATTQDAIGKGFATGNTPSLLFTSPGETVANAIVVAVNGQNGVASANDIVGKGMSVELLP